LIIQPVLQWLPAVSARRARAKARNLLVYGWFTEDFGTPDLKEVKAPLDERV
jgi:hypothetical protein